MEDSTNNHHVLSTQKTTNDLTTHPTDAFAPIIQESSIISGDYITITPNGQLTNSGPYYFTLPKNGRHLDGPNTLFYLEFKIVDGDGMPLRENEAVAFVNTIATAFIKEIEVHVAHKPISELTNTDVGHKAYLEYCLSYGKEAQKSSLMHTALLRMDTKKTL